MGYKSIVETNVALTATADQFVAEFNRADNAARRSSIAIDKEVDKLLKNVNRKFGLADFGKELMRGFGIGSGFQLAQTVADKLTEHYRAAAEAAKDMEASTARQLDYTRQLIALHQTDQQQLDTMRKEMARLEQERMAAIAPKAARNWVVTDARGLHGKWVDTTRPANDQEMAEAARLAAEIARIGLEIDKQQKKVNRAATTGAQDAAKAVAAHEAELAKLEGRLQDLLQPLDTFAAMENEINDLFYAGKLNADQATEALRQLDEARAASASRQLAEELQKQAAGLDHLESRYREMLDPMQKFAEMQDEINDLFWAGRLNAEEAAKALEKVDEQIRDAQKKTADGAHATKDAAEELGDAFQSAFEDAVIGGEKLSDVLRSLEKDILKIAIRRGITEPFIKPLGEGLGNVIKDIFSGIFRAEGGPVDSRQPYVVGERGPELFVPDVAGTVIPNHKLAAAGSAGGRGVTRIFNIDARGADKEGMANLLRYIQKVDGSIEMRAVGAVAEANQRSMRFRGRMG